MEQLKLLGRGFIGHCPNCGQGHLFHHWVTMVERCPNCGLFFEREEGYWTGAVAINTIFTELIFAIVIVAVIVWTWPDIPTRPLLIVAVALNALFPLFYYPFSKTVWVAIDLILHPLEENEEYEVTSLRQVRRRTLGE
ncbi:MAG TPA: DUF983 domain-containing protein [Nitrolancea sp.]|jgi:uncharacterized protein (DUF983 family)|nr:DUF983 domain-containing protein [Nitrolancea sp.]